MQALDRAIRRRISTSFNKVQHAFLQLDTGRKGYLTVEDFLRFFGSSIRIDLMELTKLIRDKDSRKGGKLCYQDFSKWIGSSIN